MVLRQWKMRRPPPLFCCCAARIQARLVGTRVVVHGLQGAQHLNGLCGVVASWSGDRGRWAVELAGGHGTKLLKPTNISPLDEEHAAMSLDELAQVQLSEAEMEPPARSSP